MTKAEWYAANGCSHAHCPDECENPQPIMDEIVGELLCGRCLIKFGERRPMIPCSPALCGE